MSIDSSLSSDEFTVEASSVQEVPVRSHLQGGGQCYMGGLQGTVVLGWD